ncbi:hypothetical protein [Streptomyces sp. SYP-A7185]|uniref:hypothetical protein n=1 Tax=Streptomyces sp. SYP-A7185 TaxID=3040076 RepID=UPI0038F772E1
MDTRQRDNAICEWLARAHQNPAQAWREWSPSGGGVALLPLGRAFVAPRLPEALVYAAAGTVDLQEAAAYLAQALGPVLFDGRTMGGTYYPLTWPLTVPVWKHQAVAPLLGRGTYLGVPRIERSQPPGTYWAVPPRHVGDLCEPAAVDALITLACNTARGTKR